MDALTEIMSICSDLLYAEVIDYLISPLFCGPCNLVNHGFSNSNKSISTNEKNHKLCDFENQNPYKL